MHCQKHVFLLFTSSASNFKMCARTIENIFTVPIQLLLLSLSLTLLLVFTTCLHFTRYYCPYFTPVTPSFRLIFHPHCHSSFITPHCHSAFHSICCLILSTHMLILGVRLVNTLLSKPTRHDILLST